jgi:hypothetical protein
MSRTKDYCTGPSGIVRQTLRYESSRVASHLGDSLAKTLSQALSCESQAPSEKTYSATENIYDCSGSPNTDSPNKPVISFALVATRVGGVRQASSPTNWSSNQREKVDSKAKSLAERNIYDGSLSHPMPSVSHQPSFAPIPQVDLVAVSLSLY